MRAAFESQLMDSHIQNGFSLISLLTKLSSWEKKEKAETIWTIDREAQSTSFCFLVSSPRSSPQRRATLQQAILGFYEKRSAVTVQGWAGLSYSNTPELLSLSLLTYLRRCECPTKFYPTQHCNSLFWLYIQCMCACGYNITHIYTHTYMYGVFL